MTITFKAYRRRDNSMMLYINRSNGVSIGLSPEHGFSAYGKNVTQGQRNAMAAAIAAFNINSIPFTGDLALHDEGGLCAPVDCGGFILAGTDKAAIGGMSVNSDGAYVIHKGRIAPCGVVLSENSPDMSEQEV